MIFNENTYMCVRTEYSEMDLYVGTFLSLSKCNNLVLDVEGGNAAQGAFVWMFDKNDTNAQKWR